MRAASGSVRTEPATSRGCLLLPARPREAPPLDGVHAPARISTRVAPAEVVNRQHRRESLIRVGMVAISSVGEVYGTTDTWRPMGSAGGCERL